MGRPERFVRIPDMRFMPSDDRCRSRGAAARNYWQMFSDGGRSVSLPNAVTQRRLGLEHVPAADAVGWHISWLAGAAPHAEA